MAASDAPARPLPQAVAFLQERRWIATLLLLQCVAGYLGVLAFLEAVRAFGSKVAVHTPPHPSPAIGPRTGTGWGG